MEYSAKKGKQFLSWKFALCVIEMGEEPYHILIHQGTIFAFPFSALHCANQIVLFYCRASDCCLRMAPVSLSGWVVLEVQEQLSEYMWTVMKQMKICCLGMHRFVCVY